MPNPEQHFILKIDGSSIAVGAMLDHRFNDIWFNHPVGLFNSSLIGSERNYVFCELKMYAVVRVVEHFRIDLVGKNFI